MLKVYHTLRYRHGLRPLILRRLALFAYHAFLWWLNHDLWLILVSCRGRDHFLKGAMSLCLKWRVSAYLKLVTYLVGQRSRVIKATGIEAFSCLTFFYLVLLLVCDLDQDWPEIVVAGRRLLIVGLVDGPCRLLVAGNFDVSLYADFSEWSRPIHLKAFLAWLPLFLAHRRCVDATLWLT